MVLDIRENIGVSAPASFLATAVLKQLEFKKKVLLFLTGGSSIAIGVEVSKIINEHPNDNLKNLTVTLTDERYGDENHQDSNWHQLMEKGFDLKEARLIPLLIGKDRAQTAKAFSSILEIELNKADYKIGLFGIGNDGHTAGILPHSMAVTSEKLACDYTTEKFERITITPKTIVLLDEAVVFMQGLEKWPVLRSLVGDIPLIDQPAQILKEVPLLTIFSDYK